MEETKDELPTYSVSEISGAVRGHIEAQFGRVRVRGELGRVARPQSGHIYFDIKDEKAVLSAIAWRNAVHGLQVQPEQGLEVIITGRLTTFEGQSRYQIIVETLELAGVGALMALLEERRQKLTDEGLFAPEHKQELPFLPETIGVVTSPSGAVIRDIIHRLSDRFPRRVLVWGVKVQGEGCAAEVAAAIRGFNAMASPPDLLIVARGGGSLEDLWGFNEEEVVRAVAASDIPLISAIGHETDTTLIDFAADVRAPTPTAAAELAVPVRAELQATLADIKARKLRSLTRIMQGAKQVLDAAARHLRRPDDVLAYPRQAFDALALRHPKALAARVKDFDIMRQRMSARFNPRIIANLLNNKGARLKGAARGLDLLSHESVLKRGFALVADAQGALVRHSKDVRMGDSLTIRLASNDSFAACVGKGDVDKNSHEKKSVPAKKKKSKQVKDDGQGDLL
ncbi:MAG: exodeoxyribonuclease VII large subunit [Alphaproteobacteria bacterium]|nr:exodeoxyribonuclease VII large subunit [Alphaproteobacteria bacterium]